MHKLRIETKKRQLESFAKTKFKEYAMNKWQFKFSDEYPKSSCGHCVPEWKIIFMEISTIAKYKLPTLKDIVLHEFAHAIAGKKAMHGKEFRKVCKQIGCKGNRANNNYECYELRGKFSWQE